MKFDEYEQSTALILKAAYLYYVADSSQEQISKELQVSVPTVSRLIKKAKERKIVEFVIRDPYLHCLELETQIKKRYNLKDVIVAPASSDTDLEMARNIVALEGARYIQRIITDDDILGITWGRTLYKLVQYLNPCQRVVTDFVTLHGSISECERAMDVGYLAAKVAKAYDGKHSLLAVNNLCSTPIVADYLRKEPVVQRVFSLFPNITVAVCGVGTFYPEPSSMLAQPPYMTPEELAEMQSKGAVGDVITRFFDHEGNECDTSFKNRTIAMEFEQFKRIPTKIIVVPHYTKAYTVHAALRGGVADVLITDYSLARALLDYE